MAISLRAISVPSRGRSLGGGGGGGGGTFASLTSQYAPKLQAIRDLCTGDLKPDDYPTLVSSRFIDECRYRKLFFYLGDIKGSLFDWPRSDKSDKGVPKAAPQPPGFLSESLKMSTDASGRKEFNVINLSERIIRHPKDSRNGRLEFAATLGKVLELLNLPEDGQVTLQHIHALRMFLYGFNTDRDHQDKDLNLVQGRYLATARVKKGGWTLTDYTSRPECRAELPTKIDQFCQFLHEARIVAMTTQKGKLAYPVPQKSTVILLSASVSQLLEGDSMSQLLDVLNHPLNATGALCRIVFADEKIGGVGLSTYHTTLSVLCKVPNQLSKVMQPAARAARNCSLQGLPMLPTRPKTATGKIVETPRAEQIIRVIMLSSPGADEQRIVALLKQQQQKARIDAELVQQYQKSVQLLKKIPTKLPIDIVSIEDAITRGVGPVQRTEMEADLVHKYRNSKSHAIEMLLRMLQIASGKLSKPVNPPAESDMKIMERLIEGLLEPVKADRGDPTRFRALVRFAFGASVTPQIRGSTVEDDGENEALEKRVRTAIKELFNDDDAMKGRERYGAIRESISRQIRRMFQKRNSGFTNKKEELAPQYRPTAQSLPFFIMSTPNLCLTKTGDPIPMVEGVLETTRLNKKNLRQTVMIKPGTKALSPTGVIMTLGPKDTRAMIVGAVPNNIGKVKVNIDGTEYVVPRDTYKIVQYNTNNRGNYNNNAMKMRDLILQGKLAPNAKGSNRHLLRLLDLVNEPAFLQAVNRIGGSGKNAVKLAANARAAAATAILNRAGIRSLSSQDAVNALVKNFTPSQRELLRRHAGNLILRGKPVAPSFKNTLNSFKNENNMKLTQNRLRGNENSILSMNIESLNSSVPGFKSRKYSRNRNAARAAPPRKRSATRNEYVSPTGKRKRTAASARRSRGRGADSRSRSRRSASPLRSRSYSRSAG